MATTVIEKTQAAGQEFKTLFVGRIVCDFDVKEYAAQEAESLNISQYLRNV